MSRWMPTFSGRRRPASTLPSLPARRRIVARRAGTISLMSRSTSAAQPKLPTLTRRDFFGDVADAVRASLPPGNRTLETRQTMNLLKLHYGANYRVHYEAWISAERRWLELGLHFE